MYAIKKTLDSDAKNFNWVKTPRYKTQGILGVKHSHTDGKCV